MGLRARSTELLHFLLSYPIDLICIQESNLNSSSFLWILGFSAFRYDRTHSQSCILFPDDPLLAAASSFSSGRAYPFRNFLLPLFLRLTPFSDYVGDQHLTNNSSPLSFLNLYAPLFALFRRIAEPTPFLPPSFPSPEISSF